jgi:nitroreductase
MDLSYALRSNGAVRGFTDAPVSDATITAILDDARFAPVKDPAIRTQMAGLMRPVWEEYQGAQAAGKRAFAFGLSTGDAPRAVPNPIIDQIETIPVVLAIAADLRKIAIMDGNATHRPPVVGGASIYPFCWSILLAAREHGLGGVLTTFLSRAEQAAAPLLGLPEDHALVATLFLGVPTHQNTKLKRNPVESFASIDRFDGPPLSA